MDANQPRTRSGQLLTEELVEEIADQMEAGYDPSQLRPLPVATLIPSLEGLEPHSWTAGLGGICCKCSMAGRLGDDYYSLAVIGFVDDPIHLKMEE